MDIKIKEFERQHNVKRDDIIAFVKKMPGRSNEKVNKNTILKDVEIQALMTEFVSKKESASTVPSGSPLSSSLSSKSQAALKSTSSVISKSTTDVQKPQPIKTVQSSSAQSDSNSREGKNEDDTLHNIELLNEKVTATFEKEKGEISPLTDVENEKLELAKKSGKLSKYFEYLNDINEKLNGLYKKRDERVKEIIDKQQAVLDDYNSKLDALNADREKLDRDIAEFEERKSTLQPTLDKLDEREKDVKIKEMALANKHYPEIILSLTKSMEQAQKDVLEGSHQWIGELSAKSKEYQELVKGIAGQRLELTKKEEELTEKEEEISAREEFVSLQEEELRKDVTDEMEFKYGKKIEELQRQCEVAQIKYRRLKEQADDAKGQLELIRSVFNGVDPKYIVEEFQRIKNDAEKYKTERDAKVSRADLKDAEDAYEAEKKINAELRQQLSDKRLEAVLQQARDTDEIKLRNKELEAKNKAAEVQLESYEHTYRQQQEVIERLTGDKKDRENAFEFARAADEDPELNNGNIDFDTPETLAELVNYVRSRMAKGNAEGKEKFYYSEKTIKVFLAGLHMSPISILQGISGTGKTSLPREFIKAITAGSKVFEGNDSKTKLPKAPYRICAIQSGWRDNMDLMGYFNSFDCKYNETDFFKALYVASLPKYADTLFFIILDEMNLSHPEHYFADFLSLLEQDEENQIISIKAPMDVLRKRIKGGMKIPKNVRFIGTANHDETTNSFAPKTLDRSNLLQMDGEKNDNIVPTNITYSVNYEWFEQKFAEAESKYSSYIKDFKDFIEDKELIGLLKQQGIGIGKRFADKQAFRFICVYMACGNNHQQDLAEAVDQLMTTRMLRILANKYGLDAQKILHIEDQYTRIFKRHFNFIKPEQGSKFLMELADNSDED